MEFIKMSTDEESGDPLLGQFPCVSSRSKCGGDLRGVGGGLIGGGDVGGRSLNCGGGNVVYHHHNHNLQSQSAVDGDWTARTTTTSCDRVLDRQSSPPSVQNSYDFVFNSGDATEPPYPELPNIIEHDVAGSTFGAGGDSPSLLPPLPHPTSSQEDLNDLSVDSCYVATNHLTDSVNTINNTPNHSNRISNNYVTNHIQTTSDHQTQCHNLPANNTTNHNETYSLNQTIITNQTTNHTNGHNHNNPNNINLEIAIDDLRVRPEEDNMAEDADAVSPRIASFLLHNHRNKEDHRDTIRRTVLEKPEVVDSGENLFQEFVSTQALRGLDGSDQLLLESIEPTTTNDQFKSYKNSLELLDLPKDTKTTPEIELRDHKRKENQISADVRQLLRETSPGSAVATGFSDLVNTVEINKHGSKQFLFDQPTAHHQQMSPLNMTTNTTATQNSKTLQHSSGT